MAPLLFSLKTYLIAAYGFFGLVCLRAAAMPHQRRLSDCVESAGGQTLMLCFLVGAAALLLTVHIAIGSCLFGAAVIAGVIFALRPGSWSSSATLFGGLSTAVLVLSLVWWRVAPSAFDPVVLALFALLVAALSFALSDPSRARTGFSVLPLCILMSCGLALLVDLGGSRANPSIVATLVHHWGAFIGPALHLKAGLVPLVDVPLQYGLGPTLAIAAACNGSDCWTGAEFIFTAAYLIEAVLVATMALATETPRGTVWVGAVVTIVFAAGFLWPGFPAEGNALMAMPSGGGIRFIPVTFVAWFWFFGRPKGATLAMVPAVLWSPESAAMSVAVFGLCGTLRFGFRKTALTSAALLVGSYVGLALVHRAIFGIWIDPLALIEYVVHVPGALPVNPLTNILLLIATLGLGGWLVCNPSGHAHGRHRDLAVTALLFAASSYVLGRTHPNNVCNLVPFLVLVALRALDRPAGELSAARTAAAFGLAVSAAALVFSPWKAVPLDPHIVTDIHAILTDFPDQEPDVMRLRSQIPRTPALGIADFGPYYARHPDETIVWTPMDPSSLWSFVPSERRKIYIKRSARRLRRSGWAIFADYELFLLDDLKSAYTVRSERFADGSPAQPGGAPTRYTVVCLEPKPEMAATLIGEGCPIESNGRPRAVSAAE